MELTNGAVCVSIGIIRSVFSSVAMISDVDVGWVREVESVALVEDTILVDLEFVKIDCDVLNVTSELKVDVRTVVVELSGLSVVLLPRSQIFWMETDSPLREEGQSFSIQLRISCSNANATELYWQQKLSSLFGLRQARVGKFDAKTVETHLCAQSGTICRRGAGKFVVDGR